MALEETSSSIDPSTQNPNPYDQNIPFESDGNSSLNASHPIIKLTDGERQLSLQAMAASAPSSNPIFEKDLDRQESPKQGQRADRSKKKRYPQPNEDRYQASPKSNTDQRHLDTISEFQREDSGPPLYKQKQLKLGVLVLVFANIFMVNILINIDHGVIPAATTRLKEDLKITNTQLGLLGSVVYFGLTIGSFVAPTLIQKTPPKIIILVSLFFEAVFLISFTLTKQFVLLILCRGSIGFFQVFMVIYFPVWVDLFSPREKSTLWMTLLQVAVPMGVTFGYVMTAVIISFTDWRWSFWLQTFIFGGCFTLILFTPTSYLDSDQLSDAVVRRLNVKKPRRASQKLSRRNTASGYEGYGRNRFYSNATPQNLHRSHQPEYRRVGLNSPERQLSGCESQGLDVSPNYGLEASPSSRSPGRDSNNPRERFETVTYGVKKIPKDRSKEGQEMKLTYGVKRTGIAESDESSKGGDSEEEDCLNQRQSSSVPLLGKKHKQYRQGPTCKGVFSNYVFTFTMLTIASLYFIITGIQFWVSDYMLTVLKFPESSVFTIYGVCSITATLLGVIVGGIIVHKIGGYHNPNSFKLCLFMAMLASAVAFPIPYISGMAAFVTLLSLLLFCGAFIMPTLTGTMISSVPKHHRAFANSVGAIFLNLLGYLPAPFLYGLVDQVTSHNNKEMTKSRSGMKMLMSWTIFGFSFLFVAVLAQNKVLCFKHKDKKRTHAFKYSTSVESDDMPPPPPQPREPKIVEGRRIINESEDEEEDVHSPSLKVPDSGSTEQLVVRSALNDEGDYYDEQRAQIQRQSRNSFSLNTQPAEQPQARKQQSENENMPLFRVNPQVIFDRRGEAASGYSSTSVENDPESPEAAHALAEILGRNVLNQYG